MNIWISKVIFVVIVVFHIKANKINWLQCIFLPAHFLHLADSFAFYTRLLINYDCISNPLRLHSQTNINLWTNEHFELIRMSIVLERIWHFPQRRTNAALEIQTLELSLSHIAIWWENQLNPTKKWAEQIHGKCECYSIPMVCLTEKLIWVQISITKIFE